MIYASFINGKIEVNQDVRFRESYVVDYGNGECSVALYDTYRLMTGSETWWIDERQRTVHATATNGYGDKVYFSWTICDGYTEEVYRQMKAARERLQNG